MGSRMKHLSVGQRRRMDLARATLAPKSLYLLDEPFAALDSGYRDLATRNISLLGEWSTVVISDPDASSLFPVAVELGR